MPVRATETPVLLASDRRKIAAVREIHLVVDRAELGNAQLFEHVVEDLLHALDQTVEQVAEPRRFVRKSAEFFADVLLDRLAARTGGGLLIGTGRAALDFPERGKRVL